MTKTVERSTTFTYTADCPGRGSVKAFRSCSAAQAAAARVTRAKRTRAPLRTRVLLGRIGSSERWPNHYPNARPDAQYTQHMTRRSRALCYVCGWVSSSGVCRVPLPEDEAEPLWVPGVSCGNVQDWRGGSDRLMPYVHTFKYAHTQ